MGTGELSEALRNDASQLVKLVAAALLRTIRLGGVVPAYGGGVGMGSVQDGINGILANILRPDDDIAASRRYSPTDGDDTLPLSEPAAHDHDQYDIEAAALPRRSLSLQQGQARFLHVYGIAELSKLQVPS